MLIAATVLALIVANIPGINTMYNDFWNQEVRLQVGGFNIFSHAGHAMSMLQFINDALMAIFFFTIGLEIKREVLVGELSSFKQALLPIIGAVGGMAVPVLVFYLMSRGTEYAGGAAIPMATDIAFSLGVLAMLGKRVPMSLKIFLTTLAVVDDIGGIIVIDFIDMNKAEHRQALYDHMKEVMSNDRARHNILPLSKFGLMQITRQRVRPALDIVTSEQCPSCFGKGEVQPSLLFTDVLKEKLDYLINDLKVKKFIMYVHPYVDAFLKKGLVSLYRKWKLEFGGSFKILPDQSLAYLQYKVVDSDKNIIELADEKDLESSSTKSKKKAKDRNNEE